jgi:NADH-quinone oxidoreductase subunit I
MQTLPQSYWRNITDTIQSLWKGLALTINHLFKSVKSQAPVAINDSTYFDQREGIATIQYPHQILPVPDTGRYRLHNEIDDCIVCDKCAKVCPVDCITIEPIKSTEEIGKTSDGTPKRIYAATFDIDMGKCCFCGLCTTVCPTECLTMTKVYDFSVFDIREHNYVFAEMTELEIAKKKSEYEAHQKAKNESAGVQKPSVDTTTPPAVKTGKPVFKPRMKPPTSQS